MAAIGIVRGLAPLLIAVGVVGLLGGFAYVVLLFKHYAEQEHVQLDTTLLLRAQKVSTVDSILGPLVVNTDAKLAALDEFEDRYRAAVGVCAYFMISLIVGMLLVWGG